MALLHGLRGDKTACRTWQQRARQAAGIPGVDLRDYHDALATFAAIRLPIHHGRPLAPNTADRATPTNAAPLCGTPGPIAEQATILDLDVRRRGRVGGLLHEYEHAA